MKTLGDVIKIETGEQLNKSDMLPDAEHPVVNGGIDFSGYTDKYNSEANTITISQGGASAGYVNWLNQKFWAGAHCYVVTPLPNNDVRFLYHFIKSREYNFMKNQQGAGIPSLNRSEVYKTAFPDFDYNKQKEIAEILDSFTSMITNLETELASRQKQYEYYRNKLLTFDENDESVEWKTLKEISENCDKQRKPITSSKRVAGEYPYYGASGIVDYVEGYIFDGDYLLISEDGANLVARSTPIAFSISGKNWVNNHAHVIKFEHRETRRLVEIYLNSIDLSPWITGGAQPKLNQEKLNTIPLPVPSFEKQKEIVSILDTFESLIANIKQELEARKKQYEYYREKLLTFE